VPDCHKEGPGESLAPFSTQATRCCHSWVERLIMNFQDEGAREGAVTSKII
jgi:hypothetical protein